MSELSLKTLVIAVSIVLVSGLLTLGAQYVLAVPGIMQGAVGAFAVGLLMIGAFIRIKPQLGM
jgi:hypothetical protein